MTVSAPNRPGNLPGFEADSVNPGAVKARDPRESTDDRVMHRGSPEGFVFIAPGGQKNVAPRARVPMINQSSIPRSAVVVAPARAYASRRRAAEQKGRNVHEASAPTGMMSGGLHQARAPGLATEDAGGLRAQPRAAYVVFPHEELVNV